MSKAQFERKKLQPKAKDRNASLRDFYQELHDSPPSVSDIFSEFLTCLNIYIGILCPFFIWFNPLFRSPIQLIQLWQFFFLSFISTVLFSFFQLCQIVIDMRFVGYISHFTLNAVFSSYSTKRFCACKSTQSTCTAFFLSRHCKPHFCAYPAKTRMSIHKKANYEKKNSNRKEITKRTREGERNIKRIFIKNSNASFLCMHLNGYCYCVANPSRCSSFFYILYRAEWYI